MYGKDGNLTMEFLFQAPTNRGLCWKTRMGRLIDKKLQQQNSRIYG
jgi:hypothetical protein